MERVILFFNYTNFSKYFEELSHFGIVFLQGPTSYSKIMIDKPLVLL